MKKTSLLELAKKLNIPRPNCMKTREELEEAVKDTIKGYKETILVRIPQTVWHAQMNLGNSRSLINISMIKG